LVTQRQSERYKKELGPRWNHLTIITILYEFHGYLVPFLLFGSYVFLTYNSK
jgi:hypothetical protein